MTRINYSRASKIRLACVAMVALQLAACGSPEDRAQRYYESGEKLLAAHEDQKAGVEFRNALKLKKDLLPAWRGLAQTEENAHHWEGVAVALRTILDLDPSDEVTRLKLAKLLVAGGAPEQAAKLVNAAADNNTAELHALKAVIAFKLKDTDTAVNEAQATLKIEPGNVDALVVLAADRLAQNDLTGAIQLLSRSPQTQDKDLGTQLLKLKIYAQMKDYAAAEGVLKGLIQASPQNVTFQKQLVNLYMAQHRPDDAEKELRDIVAANPKDTQSGLDLIRFEYSVKGAAAARQEIVAHINAGGDVFPYQLALAGFDYDQGNVSDSMKLLEQLGQSEPATQATKAKIMLAELEQRQKNNDAAEKILNDILVTDQRNVDALKIRASIRLERGQTDAAIADLREALNDQPRAPELMLLLASAYERSGAIDLADKEFADAMRASKFNPTVGLDYVAFLRRRGGNDRAYDVLTELATRWPNNVQVLTADAEAKLSRQDWAGAEQIAQVIKRLGNGDAVSDQILGAALGGEHKSDASIAAYQSAAASAPSAIQPMAELVKAFVSAKQFDKATAYLQSALKTNPANAQAYVLLGNVQLATNAPDQAVGSFKSAISNQPTNEIGYQALASFYIRQKQLDAAQQAIQDGLKQLPDSANLHLSNAGIFELKANYDAAISEYETALKLQPGSLVVINNLASLLADHRTDKASLDRAQSLAVSLRESQVAQFKDTLGWVYNRQGDYRASIPLLEEAVASLPGSALVRYHLGMSYIGTGQLAKASEQFQQALAQTSDTDLQAKIKASLKTATTQ